MVEIHDVMRVPITAVSTRDIFCVPQNLTASFLVEGPTRTSRMSVFITMMVWTLLVGHIAQSYHMLKLLEQTMKRERKRVAENGQHLSSERQVRFLIGSTTARSASKPSFAHASEQ